MKKRWVLAVAAAGCVWAQRDLCVPPPGGVAPTLPAKLLSGQGDVKFPITTSNPRAQEFFNQGVAQLHSFWHREAERSFLQAAALDPDAPMPQWGVAMAAAGDYRPRFQTEQREGMFGKRPLDPKSRAAAAAKKAVELSRVPGKATDQEKRYIAAVAAWRDPESKDANDAYENALRSLVEQYPKEVEVRTYLALHMMRGYTLPGREPRPGTIEAVAILRQLAREAPDHPGVHHYIIHGWEGSTFATEAWASCKRYAELTPNIPHALHMPGHIYAQTGLYADAVKSFSDAAANERGWIAADTLHGNGHHAHNVHFLATAYSFSGQYDKALESARELLALKENPREAAQVDNIYSAYRQGWIAMMRTLVQAERWDAILEPAALAATGKPRLEAWRHWAMGLAHAGRGEADYARRDAAAMDAALDELKTKAKLDTPEELKVAREELDAHIAAAAGDTAKALKIFRSAARKEAELRYSEPPYYPRPVLEAMGSLALRSAKLDDATEAFRETLERHPGSFRSSEGLREINARSSRGATGGL